MNRNLPSAKSSPAQESLQSTAFNHPEWREQFTLTTLRIASVLAVPLIVFSFPTATPNDRFLFIGMYLFLAAITVLPVPYMLRAYSLLLMSFAVGVNAIIAWGPWADGSLFLLVSVFLATLLFDRRIDLLILSISVFFTAGMAILQQTGIFQLTASDAPVPEPASWIIYFIDFSIVGVMIVLAMGQFKKSFIRTIQEMQTAVKALATERAHLEKRVFERTDELETQTSQLRTSASIARMVTEIQDITELLETVTRLISEKFGYYHVGLFIVDESRKTAFLQSASSAIGKQLVGQGFKIEPAKRSAIKTVVEQNQPVISSDNDIKYFQHDVNFPLTRSRMILPLAVRGSVLGMLDMHSDQPQAFSTQDAAILQSLADVVAISFENNRLINETKSLLAELEINTSTQTQRTWSKLTSRHKPAYQYTPAGVRPVFSKDKQENENSENRLRVPLILHGLKIGAIKLKKKGIITEWPERERILVEKIADQIALALENSRLVDEAQKSALRDQMIANISTRIRETLDIESVIRTAATELRRVFDLKEAEINIGTSQETAAPVRKSTSSLRLK